MIIIESAYMGCADGEKREEASRATQRTVGTPSFWKLWEFEYHMDFRDVEL